MTGVRTSEQIYHRVRWDPRFDPDRFVLGVQQRGREPKRVPLSAFTPGGDIPWHRVLFVEADGELVWDRATGADRLDATDAGRVRARRRLPAPFFTARAPHAWHAAQGWSPADVPQPAPGPATVRVLTWNTLWDRYDSDRVFSARRRPLLLAALREADADVVALQEVDDGLLDELLRDPWIRAGYTLGVDPAGPDVTDCGVLLLSRLPVREAGRHSLGPHKGVAAISVDTAAGPLAVVATHLSSDHSAQGAERRQAELTRLAEGLAAVTGDVVMLGDFNDGGDTPTAMLGLADAWTRVHGPEDDTATFDPVVNPLAAVSSLSGLARRLDRVLLRGGVRPTAAVLRGDRPQPDGLYLSDHYGVEVDLALGEPDGDRLDVAPTARTALAWLPPQRLWPPIQELRAAHDPQLHRWPPHVNVLFGFVPESDFERAAPLLSAAAAAVTPFGVRLDGVHTFGHRDDATIWLDPAADGDEPWTGLHRGLQERFPRCRARAEGFTAHVTLGRSTDPQRVAARCAERLGAMPARVDELVLLSRRGDEPMRPRAMLTLGTGDLRWLPEDLAPDPPGARDADTAAGSVAQRVSQALSEGVVHVTGSRRMGCALPGADLDLVAVLPGTPDPAVIAARVAAAVPAAGRVRQVTGARVPGLRLRVGDLNVDIVVVGAGSLDPAQAVDRRAELGEAAAVALSAIADADAIRAAVGDDHASFARLARRVKAWARARGLDAAPFGGLPGLAWSVLAARGVRAVAGLPDDVALHRFFEHWAGWDWRQPVTLDGAVAGAYPPGTVLTPTAPVRSCTDQLGPGGLDLLTQELYQAWEVMEAAARDGGDPWPRLAAPPPLHRRHAAWAVVSVPRPADDGESERLLGRVRGRVRALLTGLEELGIGDAHAWPRPFTTGPVTRYAIGLGGTRPDAAAFAALADRWADGLPGLTVQLTDNGAVPTLR